MSLELRLTDISNPIAPTIHIAKPLSQHWRRYSDGGSLRTLMQQRVLVSKTVQTPTRKFGAGATPFALALSRVSSVLLSNQKK